MAACESLMIATVFTPCLCSVSLFLIVSPSASPVAHNLASKTSIHDDHVFKWSDEDQQKLKMLASDFIMDVVLLLLTLAAFPRFRAHCHDA